MKAGAAGLAFSAGWRNFYGIGWLNAARHRRNIVFGEWWSRRNLAADQPRRATIGGFCFARRIGKMTKLMRTGSIALTRTLLVSAPLLALGACAAPAAPPPCDACAAASQAQATANQALTIAQQALERANAMYQRTLTK
jgi:Alanine-zipper, major outer membrane lipoprotein